MRAIACILSLSIALAAAPATAQDAREASRAEFRRGVSLAQHGDYASAKAAFAEAYRLFPHPSILLNLGLARAKTGEYVQAEQDLLRFLADDGGAPPDEVTSARQTLLAVKGHLGTFKLKVSPPGARAKLDGAPVALVAGDTVDVRAATGAHTLHVEADGYAAQDMPLDVDEVDVNTLELTLSPQPAQTEDRHRGDMQRTAGWVLVGSGAAIAGFGIFSGVFAITEANAYNTAGDAHFQDQSTRATGITFRTLADVSLVTAVLAAGAGVVLVLTAPKVKVSAGATGLWLSGSF